ncbi:hypothetical protein EON67_00965 [archaeon]|nr:MAG: hypothetical protein EON67_00965 [archaeon]
MYHIAFYAILLPVMRTAYEPALRIMLHSGKMLSAFVHHYEECAPSGVGARRMGDISAARGTILRTLNALRLSAQALPPSHFLPTHLRDHSVWATFQHRLRSDTEIILKPAMPAPPPRTPLGGVATPDNSSSFGTFSSLLSSSTYSALLGGFGQKRDEKRKADDMDWNLGSSLAKELGLEGLSPHSESSGGSSASSAVAAVARALRGGAKSSHAHDSHADIDMMGVD